MNINSLSKSLSVTAKMNEFRKNNGLRSANSEYPWYIPVLAVLTYCPNPVTLPNIINYLKNINIVVSHSAISNFKKVALGKERDPLRRNYAYKLPGMAEACGLKLGKKVKIKDEDYVGRGNRYQNTYYFRNPKSARKIILELWPITDILFEYMDKNWVK